MLLLAEKLGAERITPRPSFVSSAARKLRFHPRLATFAGCEFLKDRKLIQCNKGRRTPTCSKKN
jgi:hypothetical protein